MKFLKNVDWAGSAALSTGALASSWGFSQISDEKPGMLGRSAILGTGAFAGMAALNFRRGGGFKALKSNGAVNTIKSTMKRTWNDLSNAALDF